MLNYEELFKKSEFTDTEQLIRDFTDVFTYDSEVEPDLVLILSYVIILESRVKEPSTDLRKQLEDAKQFCQSSFQREQTIGKANDYLLSAAAESIDIPLISEESFLSSSSRPVVNSDESLVTKVESELTTEAFVSDKVYEVEVDELSSEAYDALMSDIGVDISLDPKFIDLSFSQTTEPLFIDVPVIEEQEEHETKPSKVMWSLRGAYALLQKNRQQEEIKALEKIPQLFYAGEREKRHERRRKQREVRLKTKKNSKSLFSLARLFKTETETSDSFLVSCGSEVVDKPKTSLKTVVSYLKHSYQSIGYRYSVKPSVFLRAASCFGVSYLFFAGPLGVSTDAMLFGKFIGGLIPSLLFGIVGFSSLIPLAATDHTVTCFLNDADYRHRLLHREGPPALPYMMRDHIVWSFIGYTYEHSGVLFSYDDVKSSIMYYYSVKENTPLRQDFMQYKRDGYDSEMYLRLASSFFEFAEDISNYVVFTGVFANQWEYLYDNINALSSVYHFDIFPVHSIACLYEHYNSFQDKVRENADFVFLSDSKANDLLLVCSTPNRIQKKCRNFCDVSSILKHYNILKEDYSKRLDTKDETLMSAYYRLLHFSKCECTSLYEALREYLSFEYAYQRYVSGKQKSVLEALTTL